METILGLKLSPPDLSLIQMLMRALIVCTVMYVMIRLAGRRFLAQKNPFDVLLAFLMATLIARAINGATNFWGTIVLGILMALAYRLIAWLACRFHFFGKLLKGSPQVLVRKGVVYRRVMNRFHVSEHDLHEDMRLNSGIDELDKIKIAQIERSGDISVQRQPQVLDIQVKANVQTIRLIIE